MAKMLGQDLFTQAEFDAFKANDFDRVEQAQKTAYSIAGTASNLAKKASKSANISIALSILAIAISIFAMLK